MAKRKKETNSSNSLTFKHYEILSLLTDWLLNYFELSYFPLFQLMKYPLSLKISFSLQISALSVTIQGSLKQIVFPEGSIGLCKITYHNKRLCLK